ncbi:helix-turn-helix domain-containing protein [Lactobacillus delbrueckii subsp. lactis]|jgi:cytoskeletal protein RodZ|uniref:Helix-turn-helix domain-containing protein n=1 Tax=Lactobacillus delbrueckii subsp. lactis TaxID=29397 RepID=A0A381KUW4_LACDL|nr:helix-turn-helix transcriptional regulator [Lactobacillus delbrueckii]AZA16522.1 MAG: helix-turn-helix domain-containing protein [Lactobacillus delbrueckii subsp. lactis]AZA24899.1 MAG: helix-turn-helix domain-containing protein [Lactobacillus delbrueckii subsp. lactis]MBO1167605.1 helix-turn-helix domain-containing protein [Lactobacillus delbrueckii subsp. lactis]MBO1169284.1 helix-turn-helix domain-containing protein [Lactobacillus delbrueckii subsp. lactis]MBO1170914.1 helix-turn-helix d
MSGIGEQLRKAREAKGLSISDIEKATKIQSRYLEAIENNDFDKLPGDFYVRAFIRQYAQIVGLDGKELLSQYQGEVANEVTSEVSQPAASSPAQEVHEEAHEEEAAPVEPARISASRPAKREAAEKAPKDAKWRKLVPRLALGCGIALLLLIGGMVFANMKKTGSSSQKENAGSSVTITSKKSSSKKSSSASSSSKKKKTSSIKVASLGGSSYRVTGIKSSTPLVVRSSKQSIYYYVSVDNVITNQGTLQSGEKHTETVKKGQTLIVYLGTDTGVTVTVGGKKIPFTPINGTTRLTIYLGDSSASASSSAASRTTSTNTNTNTSTSYSSRASSSVQSSASSRPAASSSSVQSSSQASSSAAPSSQSSAAPSSSAASSSKQ